MAETFMVAQEHMGSYDAIRSGTARNSTTLAAAVATLGSAPTTLVLTKDGDGVWALTSNLTTPTSLAIFVPAGVTVNIAAGITWTCNGPIIAQHATWKTGSGTLARGTSAPMELSVVEGTNLTIYTTASSQGVAVRSSAAAAAKAARMFVDQGGGNVGIRLTQNESVNSSGWEIDTVVGTGLCFARPGSTYIMQLNDNGLGIGGSITPSTFLLQVAGDGTTNSAAKPTGGSWSNSASDSRLKRIGALYTRGLAFLRSLPPVKYYQYNGKGGSIDNGKDHVGYIADDLLPVVPEWVFTSPGKLDPEDEETVDLKGLNDSELVYALVNAAKEQADIIEALDARVATLEGTTLLHTASEEEADTADVPRTRRKRT